MGTTQAWTEAGGTMNNRIKITDASGSDGYLTNSPAGEYGILFATASATSDVSRHVTYANQSFKVGLIYYQAGVVVLSGSVFTDEADGGILNNAIGTNALGVNFGQYGLNSVSASNINTIADGIRARMFDLSFNNTTELNSTIYL